MNKDFTVRQSRVFNASQKQVWNAWTQPNLMKQWFCPLGMNAVEIEADVRVGGTFRIVMDARGAAMQPPPEMGGLLTAYGTYQRVVPPTELEFSWAWEGREEISRVSVTINPKGSATELVLVHDGLNDEASRIFHEDGWKPTLDNLFEHFRVRLSKETAE
jgi:uncharacterized protein YndB with AHSA1/START domain